MKKKKLAVLLLLAMVSMFVLAACTQKANAPAAVSPAATPVPTQLEVETAGAEMTSDSTIARGYLHSVGITPEELKENLEAHFELNPFEGVVGGTCALLPDETVILSENWVYARAEDGHVSCAFLYEYTIDSSKKITWKLIGYDQGEGFKMLLED